jgi:putative FmdB family regulatory protein
MPIYEYRCAACGRKASIFFRSLSVVEENPECPHCGEQRLERRMSRVWSHRSASDDAFAEPVYEEQGVPFYGADPFSDPYGYDEAAMTGDDDEAAGEEDIAAMAREARAMAQMMGEPLDESFDTALRHVEQGADPDEVFGELDAAESRQEPPSDSEP